jgi:hypothetical protein
VRTLKIAAHASRRLRAILPGKRMVLAEAVLNLAAARLKHAAVPFDRLVKEFGGKQSPSQTSTPAEPKPVASLSETDRFSVETVKWAVESAARYVPFRAVCLQQAMAAHAMLNRRHIESEMHFGVLRKPDGSLAAHAWLSAGHLEVTGFPLEPNLVEMTRFVPGQTKTDSITALHENL